MAKDPESVYEGSGAMPESISDRTDPSPMSGGLSALEDFIRVDRRGLVLSLLSLGLTFDEAQDVVGDTYERLLKNWTRIESPKQWCRITAYRLAIDVYRTNRRASTAAAALGRQSRGVVLGAEDLAMLSVEHRTVMARLRALPPKQREAFVLHLEGFANTEIAELTMAKESTVASNIRHARAALRSMLEGDEIYTARSSKGGDIDGE